IEMDDQSMFDEFGNLREDVEDLQDDDQEQAVDDDEEANDLTGIDDSRDRQDRMYTNGHANDDDGDERMHDNNDERSDLRPSNAIVLHEDKKYFPDASEVYGDAEVMVQDEDTQPISKPIIAPQRARSFNLVDKDLPNTVYSKQFLVDLLQYPALIRNVCLIGNISSGKTSFMDMLFLQTHEKKWTHSKPIKYTDTRKDEQQRGLSIKAMPMTLLLPNSKEKSYLCNIMDTPGHMNFSDEVTASLRLCDGAVIVVDALEGVMLQTERLITHAVSEGLAISVIINKIDRLILELKLPPQDAYFKLKHTIDEINTVLEKASHGTERVRVSPELGNVLFASSEMGWCFTLNSFANIYADSHNAKFSADEFAKRLWGDLYFQPDTRAFRRKSSPSHPDMQRTFVHFILDPLYKIYSTILCRDKKTVENMLFELGIRLPNDTLGLDVKPLLRIVLGSFFGKSTGFVDMIVAMPSPIEGATRKVEHTYTGSLAGDYGKALKSCDPDGPLMLHVSKLISKSDGSGFDCLARVMSGTITKGTPVRILGEKYTPDNDEDLVIDEITRISICEARYQIDIERASAGTWVLLEGVDNAIVKTATITSVNDIDEQDDANRASIFRPLQFNTKSVCKVAIEPLNPSELPKMLAGLRKINKSYPLAVTRAEESGEHIILGTGELYLDCILHDLRTMYAEIEIKVDDPVICLAETIIETSAIKCHADTQNKKNRLTMICEPLEKGLADDIESGLIKIDWPKKKRTEFFQNKYGWDVLAANNLWAFGPDACGANVLINDTIDVNRANLMSISESVVRGFQWATKEGPLVDEPVRNVKFKLIDATIASEPIARSSGHIVPAARSSTHSAFLVAAPRLMEPVYMVEVISPPDCVQSIESVLTRRRGHIIHDYPKPGTPLYITKALLPVLDSYGFETDLRSHTQGQAFCLSTFDHWQIVPGDPLDKSVVLQPLEPSPQAHLARELLIKTRRRKGLSEDVNLSKHLSDEQLLNLANQT
ncbi:hypothetical protein SAMD00019534_034680, partial [Acytostelium subglobosum LB1]|uniref:hypothetical protein n=1 Tax=Acytostelium subglobosum LB1 TaxID=1410327 RepID=UPI0006450FD3